MLRRKIQFFLKFLRNWYHLILEWPSNIDISLFWLSLILRRKNKSWTINRDCGSEWITTTFSEKMRKPKMKQNSLDYRSSKAFISTHLIGGPWGWQASPGLGLWCLNHHSLRVPEKSSVWFRKLALEVLTAFWSQIIRFVTQTPRKEIVCIRMPQHWK